MNRYFHCFLKEEERINSLFQKNRFFWRIGSVFLRSWEPQNLTILRQVWASKLVEGLVRLRQIHESADSFIEPLEELSVTGLRFWRIVSTIVWTTFLLLGKSQNTRNLGIFNFPSSFPQDFPLFSSNHRTWRLKCSRQIFKNHTTLIWVFWKQKQKTLKRPITEKGSLNSLRNRTNSSLEMETRGIFTNSI